MTYCAHYECVKQMTCKRFLEAQKRFKSGRRSPVKWMLIFDRLEEGCKYYIKAE